VARAFPKPPPDHVGASLLKRINEVRRAQQSRMVVIQSAQQRLAELETEERQILRAAESIGVVFETDPVTNLRRIATGDAASPDPHVTLDRGMP